MIYDKFIKNCLLDASKIALDGFGKVESKIKSEGNMQVLTETDLKIGSLLIAAIQRTYPDHNIINEETGVIDKNSEFTWTIDPIDGTSNYASKIPMFGTMLGLLQNDTPIAGGIVLPVFNEVYYAEKDCGAFCNEEKISVSKNPDLNRNFVAYLLSSHPDNPETTNEECETLKKLIPNIMSLRTSNCTAFDGSYVASGRYGLALNTRSYIWDCVPLHIVVEEAGGIFTDNLGETTDYSDCTKRYKQYFRFCTGAKGIHEQVQALIK